MRLLDRYLLRELITPLGYCLGGFLIFWISFDLISELDDFQREKLRAYEIAQYYVVKLPELLGVVVPVALLLGLLYALTNHARHHELTAMRAAGLSLLRLCVPYFGVGLFFSAALYLLNERWVPNSADRAEQIRKHHTVDASGADDRQWQRDLTFHNGRDDRFWRILAYNVETGEMREPYVAWRRPDGSRRELSAQRAIRTNGVWTFYNVRHSLPAASPDSLALWQFTNELAVAEFSETPEQIKSEIKISRLNRIKAAKRVQLSIAEILDYKRLHPDLRPRDRALLDTQLHARLAAPWTCLVVVLIAIPFGAQSGRRNVFVGVASSILICFSYFVIQQVGMHLGTGGFVPPLLGAWLPNVVFGSAGFWLILRVK
jgi:lipopolysaccharide export system permease protein